MSDKPPQHWLMRFVRIVLLVLAASLPIVAGIFIAGPDAIRNFPKVPAAIRETANSMWDEARLKKQLTGVWNNQTHQEQDLITIELWVNDQKVEGTITAPTYIGKWRPVDMPKHLPSFPTALLSGVIEGNALKVEVFDFLDSKRVEFAKITIWFGEDIGDLATESEDYINELRAETEWQISPALPQSFILTPTKQ